MYVHIFGNLTYDRSVILDKSILVARPAGRSPYPYVQALIEHFGQGANFSRIILSKKGEGKFLALLGGGIFCHNLTEKFMLPTRG